MPLLVEQEQETSLADIQDTLDGVYWTAVHHTGVGRGSEGGIRSNSETGFSRDRWKLGCTLRNEGNLRCIGDCTGDWAAVVPQEAGQYSLRRGDGEVRTGTVLC